MRYWFLAGLAASALPEVALAQSGGTTAITPPATTAVWAAEDNDSSTPPQSLDEGTLELPEPAFGASLALKSTHIDLSNATRYTADPVKSVIEGEAFYRFAGNCQIGAWGVRAIGHDDSRDIWEVDIAAGCEIDLGSKTSLSLSAEQWFLPGPDITAGVATVTHGAVDVNVTYMATAGTDGQRAEIGVTLITNDHFEWRLAAGVERGFDLPTTGVIYTAAEHQLGHGWSAFANGAWGFAQHGDPRRGTKVEIGIRYSFGK
jgi:hypothetical protein